MTDQPSPAADAYALDANVMILMNRHMPRDVFPSVWEAVEALAADGRVCTPRQVYEELLRIDDYCAPWARGMPGFVVEADDQEIAVVAAISTAHPGWVRQQLNVADPWLVANGAAHGRIVVTDERLKGPGTIDNNLKIPNVAAEHGVICVAFTDMARREGWSF